MASSTADDEYEIPLRDQRYFGAGIKRKRIHFVPSTTHAPVVSSSRSTASPSAADRYLSIVLKRQKADEETAGSQALRHEPTPEPQEKNGEPDKSDGQAQIRRSDDSKDDDTTPFADSDAATCVICNPGFAPSPSTASTTPAPTSQHEKSLTHQIRLAHSHPPSHLDRRRLGLNVLARQGWDPDSRRGLGAEGEGMLHPIKATENPARAGLGVRVEDLARLERKAKQDGTIKMDAGAIQRKEKESRRKAVELRDLFYRSEDVERYLGDTAGRHVDEDGLAPLPTNKWR